MIRTFYILVFIAFFISLHGISQQNNELRKGVTIITHGFALGGSYNPEFTEFGTEVYNASGSVGTVYLLNAEGEYEKIIGDEKPEEEIIIVFDWANLSWDFTRKSKNGDLEAAADFLFAALMAPPPNLNLTGKALFEKPIHLIGHSRGGILLLQLCHRIKRYLPNVAIEQLTLLDPHPATPFGDIGGFLNGNVPSLPGVSSGTYTLGAGYMIDQSIELKIPDNVMYYDGYFRRDNQYEEVISQGVLALASFDGVRTKNNFNHNELNENIISFLANPGGGSHSAVVKWYRGTIPNSTIDANNNGWYSNAVGAFFDDNDSRYSVGYIHSRIGSKGNYELLPPALPQNLKATIQELDVSANSRQGFVGGIQRVFNGRFIYGSAGWRNRGGEFPSNASIIESDVDRFNNQYTNYLSLPPSYKINNEYQGIKHNYFYFGTDAKGNSYQTISFEVYPQLFNPQNALLFKFYNASGTEIFKQIFRIDNDPKNRKLIQIPVPETLKRSTGTFSIENISTSDANINLGRFELLTSSPTNTSSLTLNANYFRTEQSVHLNWSDFTIDETEYIVTRADSEEGPFSHLVGTLPPNSNFIEDKLLAPSATYWYRVQSVSPTTPDAFTNIDSITIAEKPPAPSTITAAVFNDRDIEISWNDATDVETSYELYYKMDNGGGYSLLKSLPANTTSYTLVNVPANTTITFYVKSKELTFLSEQSPEASATVGRGPIISRILKVEAFIDETPGVGQGIVLSGDLSKSDVFATTTIPVKSLSDGIHAIYIRSLDTKGFWSNTYSGSFLKLSTPVDGVKLNDLQYSLNASASGATWTDVYFDPNITDEGITVNIEPSIISSLQDGIHFITIRAKDNKGFWSNYFHQSFLKLTGSDGNKRVLSLEYSIDNGLLIGTGTAVTLTPGSYANVSIDLPPLPNGKHFISLRAKDDGGYSSNVTIDSFVVRDQSFCEKNSIVYYRSLINNAKTYVWQQNDGTGWITINDGGIYSGCRTQILKLDNPPTSWYGYQYRCIVNGVPTAEYTLKFSDTWTGAESDEWHNPNNWCCGGVPDENTDVIIDPSTLRKPKITANGICRSLTLKPGSNITLEAGNALEVMGQRK